MKAADLSCQHWILIKLELIKTNEAIMQMWGCRDLPCYICFTFSGPLADSLMLCILWIRKVVHLPVSQWCCSPYMLFLQLLCRCFSFNLRCLCYNICLQKGWIFLYSNKKTCLLPEDFHRQQLGWTNNGNGGDYSHFAWSRVLLWIVRAKYNVFI